MRLTPKEIKVIQETILKYDPEAKIHLFGSRVDDHKKGGDIDLLVFSKILTYSDRLKIKAKLYDDIDWQKIDLVVTTDGRKTFEKMVLKGSVPL
jgi:predicted nucleotidyltransferase